MKPKQKNNVFNFVSMETKEKCEEIIQILNAKKVSGSNDPLLVKFADGGGKKKHFKNDGDGGRSGRYRNDADVRYHNFFREQNQ